MKRISNTLAGFGALACSALLALPAQSEVTEEWVRKDGGERGAAVATDEDGNVYVTGNSSPDVARNLRSPSRGKARAA